MEESIIEAIKVLKQGGIVIYPTDTAFGIGCKVDDNSAVKRLFKIRRRPITQATPVLIDSVKMLQDFTSDVPVEVYQKLVNVYWPGALTIVFKARTEKIPGLVRGGTDTVGLRIPNHPTTLQLIKKIGTPLIGPSANFHGGKTPYSFSDLDPELIKLVDYVVPGECTVKQASTVIDITQAPWRILRQGAIFLGDINE